MALVKISGNEKVKETSKLVSGAFKKQRHYFIFSWILFRERRNYDCHFSFCGKDYDWGYIK